MFLLVLHWLASASASEPLPPGDPVPTSSSGPSEPLAESTPDPTSVSFSDRLAEAKQAYFEGRQADALRLFRDLEARLKVRGEQPSWDEAAEAMTYLGEIYLAQDKREEAEESFRWVLERDIETPMRSPYRHPMEVVTLFEDVRGKVAREQRERVPPPPQFVERPRGKFPAYIFIPVGVPQFWQRRPVAGAFAAATEIGLGISSLVVYKNLQAFNVPNDLEGDELAQFQQDVRQREALSVTLGITTYVTYFAWVAEAGISVGRQRRAAITLSTTPEGAPAFALRGTL